jgi:hypothetical protein
LATWNRFTPSRTGETSALWCVFEIKKEIPVESSSHKVNPTGDEMLKKSITAILVLAAAFWMQTASASAQQNQQASAATQSGTDQDIQLLRQDLRSQKKQIIAANMPLTDVEATKFWPVYDQYTSALTKIGDDRTALIKEYAQSYDTMTDAQAKSLIKLWAATDEQAVQLRMQYIPKFEQVLPGKKAVLFFQLDRRIGLLIDLQLASMIPMVNQ